MGTKLWAALVAILATVVAALSIGTFEGWLSPSYVDNIPAGALGVFSGIAFIVAIGLYAMAGKSRGFGAE
jgi:H+/gluconate symporter-like permease